MTIIRLVLIAVIAVFAMGCGEAGAHVSEFYHVGDWSAFAGIATNGKRVCGIMNSDVGDDRYLLIKYFNYTNFMTFQLAKKTWNIPKGTKIRLALAIDNDPAWRINAIGTGQLVEWALNIRNLAKFEGEFKRGSVMTILFLTGNEPPWRENLLGSNKINFAFSECLRVLRKSDKSTQPFSVPRPTMPSRPISPLHGEGPRLKL